MRPVHHAGPFRPTLLKWARINGRIGSTQYFIGPNVFLGSTQCLIPNILLAPTFSWVDPLFGSVDPIFGTRLFVVLGLGLHFVVGSSLAGVAILVAFFQHFSKI